jgi:hypothetical protein
MTGGAFQPPPPPLGGAVDIALCELIAGALRDNLKIPISALTGYETFHVFIL